jgi:hypothetical protein
MKTVSFRMVLSTDFRPSRRVRTAPGPVVDSFRSNFRRKRSTSTSERRFAVSRCRNCLGSNTRSFQCFDRFGSVWRRKDVKSRRWRGIPARDGPIFRRTKYGFPESKRLSRTADINRRSRIETVTTRF